MADLPVVTFREVTFSYDRLPVLENVSLTVRENELISIVGPNGGGKTTLLKLILGLITPSAGDVRVFGRSPRHARRRIGYMPQYLRFDPHFPVTVMDVVLMGRLEKHWAGPYWRKDKDRARSAMAEVGLEDLSDHPFSTLSGGQRQRILIARALACDPDLLLLDEPTASVDVVAEGKLYEILQRLKPRMTILIVSHDLGFVSDIVQSVICVNRRVVVHPTGDITGQIIRDIYGEELRMVRHGRECSDEGHGYD